MSPLYGQLEAGTIIAQYRIASLLGSGGMGAVYLADHLALHSQVALKVVRPDIADLSRVGGGADICAAPVDGSGGLDLVPGPTADAVTAWTAA